MLLLWGISLGETLSRQVGRVGSMARPAIAHFPRGGHAAVRVIGS